MWVLDHLEDLEADFLRFFRVVDISTLDGPRFFRLAARTFAYDGVMSARLQEEVDGTSGAPRASQGATGRPERARDALAGPIPEGGRRHANDIDVAGLSSVAPWLMERKAVTSDG